MIEAKAIVVSYVDHFTPLTELKQKLNREQQKLDDRLNDINLALKKLTDEKEFVTVAWQELEEQMADILKTQSHMGGILARANVNPIRIEVLDREAVFIPNRNLKPVPSTQQDFTQHPRHTINQGVAG